MWKNELQRDMKTTCLKNDMESKSQSALGRYRSGSDFV